MALSVGKGKITLLPRFSNLSGDQALDRQSNAQKAAQVCRYLDILHETSKAA
jgi:hypothetical protein